MLSHCHAFIKKIIINILYLIRTAPVLPLEQGELDFKFNPISYYNIIRFYIYIRAFILFCMIRIKNVRVVILLRSPYLKREILRESAYWTLHQITEIFKIFLPNRLTLSCFSKGRHLLKISYQFSFLMQTFF